MTQDLIPAVAYCRVSSRSDSQKNSYEAQIRHFREKANELGYKLVDNFGTFGDGIYADKGISGKSLNKREEFKKMLEDTQKGEFKAILVTNASRFSRNAVDGMNIIRQIKKDDVYVHFLSGNLKSCDKSDEFMMDFFLVFAQGELRDLSKKIQDGIRKAQNRGVWTSNAPYGYDKVNGFLKVNEQEEQVVKMIFDLYVHQGMSIDKISKTLNEREIPTKNGSKKKGRKWYQSTVRNLLKNEIYIGKQIGHQVEMEDIFINKVKKVDDDERIIHPFDHLRIIDNETFHLAQEKRIERAKLAESNNKYSAKHILSNLFYCGSCGASMKRMSRTNQKGQKQHYYLCSNRHRDIARCEFYNYIREEEVFQYLKDTIANNINNANFARVYNHYVNKYLGNDFTKQLPQVQEKIDKLEKRKFGYFQMHADGDMTKEDFRKANAEVVKELEELNNTKRKIENISYEIAKAYRTYKQFMDSLKTFDPNNIANNELRNIIKRLEAHTVREKQIVLNLEFNLGFYKKRFLPLLMEALHELPENAHLKDNNINYDEDYKYYWS